MNSLTTRLGMGLGAVVAVMSIATNSGAQEVAASAAVATPEAAMGAGGTDHDMFVGRFAVGYLGASEIAVGTLDSKVTAPVVGLRYWLNPMMGIDAGLGFHTSSGEDKQGSVSTDRPSRTAFILHAGVPVSLAQGKHISFQVVPEANLGIASGSNPAGTEKTDVSGFRLDLGARAGAEVHFGFMGLPELSLQGSIGARLAVASATTDPPGDTPESKQSLTVIETTVGDNPWNIFNTNVAALYYF